MKNKDLLSFKGAVQHPVSVPYLSRVSLDSILSRLCLASLICLCMMTVGVGKMWGEDKTSTLTLSSSNKGTTFETTDNGATWSGNTSSIGANRSSSMFCVSGTITVKLPIRATLKSVTATLNNANSWGKSVTLTFKAGDTGLASWAKNGSSKAVTISSNQTAGTYTFVGSGNAWVESLSVTYAEGSGSGGGESGGDDSGCKTIDVTNGSAVILPAGSTSYSQNDWKDAGAPAAYPDATTEYSIGDSKYCVTLTKAGDYNNADGLQFQAKNGILKITGITSTAGVDVEIVCSGSNGFKVELTGATEQTSKTGTVTISTTSTSADLTISKNTDKVGYVKTIKITPKAPAAPCTATPTVGDASLNGAFSLSSVGVTVTCCKSFFYA